MNTDVQSTDARFPAIASEDYTPAQNLAAAALMQTPRGEVRGPFVPLLYSPELLDRTQRLGAFLRYECSLDKRLRETAILTVAAHWKQGYEWQAHLGHARAAGVASATIAAIEAGTLLQPECPADECEVVAFCRDLLCGGDVKDSLFADMTQRFGREGAVELAGICGYYSMLAFILNLARIAG